MMAQIQIAAHPYGYVREVGSDLYAAAHRIFAELSEAGYDAIELMHTMLDAEEATERIRDLSAEHGLPVMGSSFGAQMYDPEQSEAILARTARIAGQLGALGGHHLGISTGSTGEPKTDEQLDTQAAVVREMIGICADHGVTLDQHNHTYEAEWDLHEIRGMLQRIPELRLGPDLNWLLRAGVDPYDFLRRYRDRIVFMHLRGERDGRWTEALGEGEEDLDELAATLKEIGYEGPVGVELALRGEHELTRTMGENYAVSARNLREALGGLAAG